MKNIRSRILQHLPQEVLIDLDKLCHDMSNTDNNKKSDRAIQILKKHNIDAQEIGPGTNRLAVLIDGYIFKIAMDKWGIRDNWNEFTTTEELQPFVTKVYECNGLIMVAEFVTVFSKEEFQKKVDDIRKILGILSEGYLLGDVGTVNKNFMNWGYRDNGEIVILDFAYVYKIKGDEMICGHKNKQGEVCTSWLDYDTNFHNLLCPKCGKKYSFIEIRKRIDMEFEERENEMAKKLSYKLTKEIQQFKGTDENTNEKEKEDMSNVNDKYSFENEETEETVEEEILTEEDEFENLLNSFRNNRSDNESSDIKESVDIIKDMDVSILSEDEEDELEEVEIYDDGEEDIVNKEDVEKYLDSEEIVDEDSLFDELLSNLKDEQKSITEEEVVSEKEEPLLDKEETVTDEKEEETPVVIEEVVEETIIPESVIIEVPLKNPEIQEVVLEEKEEEKVTEEVKEEPFITMTTNNETIFTTRKPTENKTEHPELTIGTKLETVVSSSIQILGPEVTNAPEEKPVVKKEEPKTTGTQTIILGNIDKQTEDEMRASLAEDVEEDLYDEYEDLYEETAQEQQRYKSSRKPSRF